MRSVLFAFVRLVVLMSFVVFGVPSTGGEGVGVCLRVGDIYRIRDNIYVPVFMSPQTKFEYEVGFRGNNCYEMDTVLLPGFYVRIDEVFENGIIRVTATRDNSYSISGYIHRKFIVADMVHCAHARFESLYSPPTVPEIDEVIAEISKILSKRSEYCYGGNSPQEVSLDGLYEFRQISSGGAFKKFRCRGFDALGLIHYLSNGYLPHKTSDIITFGKCICVIDPKHELTNGKMNDMINKLRDTDLVIIVPGDRDRLDLWKALVFYKFGFVESKGPNLGIVRTHPSELEAKMTQMVQRAKSISGKIYFIRWHPDLLKSK
ncbi:MAG: hypothetical protein LBB18_00415 [Puniceicoccales bacterium]|jgi:hypothetical protein|nr:hypothetical protein [Puniceicoccales bacterium]